MHMYVYSYIYAHVGLRICLHIIYTHIQIHTYIYTYTHTHQNNAYFYTHVTYTHRYTYCILFGYVLKKTIKSSQEPSFLADSEKNTEVCWKTWVDRPGFSKKNRRKGGRVTPLKIQYIDIQNSHFWKRIHSKINDFGVQGWAPTSYKVEL